MRISGLTCRSGDPSFSDLRFFVSLKFSITFFLMPSAVSLSSCLEEESASANHPERFHFPFSSSLIFLVNFFLSSIYLSLTALLSLSCNFGGSIPFSMASYTRPRSRLPFFTTNTFPADILVTATHHTPSSTPFASIFDRPLPPFYAQHKGTYVTKPGDDPYFPF